MAKKKIKKVVKKVLDKTTIDEKIMENIDEMLWCVFTSSWCWLFLWS